MPATKPMPVAPRLLRATTRASAEGVDREAKAIRGIVVAQEGLFKSPGRGRFDVSSLQKIVKLGNAKPKGLRSHYAHPTLSDDGIGKFLGRVTDFRMGKAIIERDGKMKEVSAVRGDLHFAPSAFSTPSGDLATYVMDRVEEDSDAISSSLQILPTELWEEDPKTKKRLKDEQGNELPPLWIPEKLFASDLVNEGDAVDGLLSANLDADALPDAAVRRGAELLDRVFAGQSREVVEERCVAWLARYLNLRFGDAKLTQDRKDHIMRLWMKLNSGPDGGFFMGPRPEEPETTPRLDKYRLRLKENALAVERMKA